MSFDTLRDPVRIENAVAKLQAVDLPRPVRIMEVCGGHTAAIYRFGIHQLLPAGIDLISGPGCPVCVTPVNFIDHAIALGEQENTLLATFGDLIKVPGTRDSLSSARGKGVQVKVCYSPVTALEFAENNPHLRVIFLGVGFETTACTIAATLAQAVERGIKNFKVLPTMKTMPAALRALISSPETRVDGLILPGHVSTVTGTTPFEFIANELNVACAVSGFEPLDILDCITAIVEQIAVGKPQVQNRYKRAVQVAGNKQAQSAIGKLFEPCFSEWRGLGDIAESGLAIRAEFSEWDASLLPVDVPKSKENSACKCGDVLRGAISPRECPLFGKGCMPEHAIGACMVSSEGACAAVYNYQTEYAD
jgi:hydrogenase expression/formation protein HypD